MKTIILSMFLSLWALPAWADDARIDCQGCHTKTVSSAAYAGSAHRDLACTACHIRDLKQPVNLQAKDACVVRFAKTDCARCHAKQTKEHEASVHFGKRLPIACAQCHTDIHALTPHKGDKLASAALCGGCHARQKPYFSSIHYQALQKGSKDAPSCTDCHGNHTVARVDNDAKGRDLHSKACLKCHDDRAMMTRNKVTTIAGATFFDSFHGKNVRLGYPEQVAGCADCHTAHAVQKADNPASTVHPSHLVATCQTCHKHANAAFTQYAPHAQDHDRAKFPLLYWTRTAMTGLLVGTFLFFWLHSLLWALRLALAAGAFMAGWVGGRGRAPGLPKAGWLKRLLDKPT